MNVYGWPLRQILKGLLYWHRQNYRMIFYRNWWQHWEVTELPTIIVVFRLPSLLRWLSMYPYNFFTCLYPTAASSSGTISLVICFNHLPIHQPSQLMDYTLNIIPTWRWCDRDNVIMRSPDHHRPDLSGFAANCSRIISLDHQCRIYLLLSENLIDTVRIPNRFPGFPGDIPRPMIVRFKPLVRDSSRPLCIRQDV